MFVLCLLLMAGLYAYVQRTATGTAMRAPAMDRDAAQLMGINVERTILLTFLIGSVLAGASGVLRGLYYTQINFFVGFLVGLRAFTASGGEQQMPAIGRALMTEPRLLCLDEPSMGLAPIVVRAVGEVIRRIRAGGTAILMVEQNARQAFALAERAYVLETGRIVLSGSARELSRNPRVQAAYLGGSADEEPTEPTEPTEAAEGSADEGASGSTAR